MIGYFKTVKAGIQNDSGSQPRIINKKEVVSFGIDYVPPHVQSLLHEQFQVLTAPH